MHDAPTRRLDAVDGSSGPLAEWTAALVDHAREVLAVVDIGGNLLYANPAAERLLHRSATAEVGQNMFEYVHPDDRDTVMATFSDMAAVPGPGPLTRFRMRTSAGEWMWLETAATNLLNDPAVAAIVVTGRDVGDHMRVERLSRMYRTLVWADQSLSRTADTDSLFRAVCDTAVAEGGLCLAWVGLVDGDAVTPVAVSGEPRGYVSALGVSLGAEGRGPTATAIVEDRPVAVVGVDDPLLAPWREQFVAAGFASSCAVPIRQAGRVTAAFSVYAAEPEFFGAPEVDLLVELASHVSFALDRLAFEAERAQAEVVLRRSEERFRALVEGSTDAVCVLSGAQTISFMTASVTGITGWPPEHYIGTDALDSIHPDDRTGALAELRAADGNDGSRRARVRVRHRDGGWRWVELGARNMLEDPAVTGIVVNFRDVTAERAAHERLSFQARMLDAVSDAVIASDAGGHIVYWNQAATRMYGWSVEEALGRTLSEVIVDLSDEEVASVASRLAGGLSWTGRWIVKLRTGGTLPVRVEVSPVFDEAGDVVGMIGASTDLTEPEALAAQLQETSGFLRSVTESMAEGMFTLDLEGRATLVNRAAAELLGWPPDGLMGQPMHELTHFERFDGTPLPVEDCPILTAQTRDQVVRVARDSFIRRDGTRLPVAYLASPLHGDGIRGCVVVFRDISDELVDELRAQAALDKLAWVGRIVDALDDDRFVLVAQPIMDLATSTVTEHELLLRLRITDGQLVPPGEFLPVAEEFGLIKRLDRWVLGQACAAAAAGHSVSFNLSAVSLGDPATRDLVAEAIAAANAPPHNLVCEITETAFMEHPDVARETLRSIRALGCGIALDDFGIGFGGFTYLKTLPLTCVKIDRAFVADVNYEESSQHVVRAIVHLAQAFGLETIAEGAESMDVVERLRELGVDAVQGYIIGHPAPLDVAFAPQPH